MIPTAGAPKDQKSDTRETSRGRKREMWKTGKSEKALIFMERHPYREACKDKARSTLHNYVHKGGMSLFSFQCMDLPASRRS